MFDRSDGWSAPMSVLLLLILACLCTLGAGILPGVLPGVAVLTTSLLTICPPCRLNRLARHTWWLGTAFLAFTAFTLLPLPASLVGRPRARYASEAARARWLFREAERQHGADDGKRGDKALSDDLPVASPFSGGPQPRVRLTLNAAGTIRVLWLVSAAWAVLWLGRGIPPDRRTLALTGLVLLGSAVALCGLLGRYAFPQGKSLLWFVAVDHGSPMGPFVNRNHFAAFCAMLAPAAFCLMTSSGRLWQEHAGDGFDEQTLRASARSRWSIRVVGLVGLAILVASVILSLSRGGFLALMAGLAIPVAVSFKSSARACVLGGLAAVVLMLAVVFWPSSDFHDRIGSLREAATTDSGLKRLQTAEDAIRMWRRFPLAGVGHEGFRVVFPLYKTHTTRKDFTYAEMDYVQLLCDGGLVGTSLFLGACACCLVSLIRAHRHTTQNTPVSGHGSGRRGWGLGGDPQSTAALGAFAAMGAHAVVDFALRIPLNALTFAVILGLGLSSSLPGERRGAVPTPGAPKRTRALSHRLCAFGLLVMSVAFLLVGRRQAWSYDHYERLLPLGDTEVLGSLAWAPTYWGAWYEGGRRAALAGSRAGGSDRYRGAMHWQDVSIAYLRKAADLNPSNYRMWRTLSEAEEAMGNQERSAAAFERVIQLRPRLRPR